MFAPPCMIMAYEHTIAHVHTRVLMHADTQTHPSMQVKWVDTLAGGRIQSEPRVSEGIRLGLEA